MSATRCDMRLTEKRVRDAKPKARTYILRDDETPGLGLRVTPSGAKAFVLDYHAAGRRRLMTLARPGEIPLAEARHRAGRERAALRDGGPDPLQLREDARRAPVVADLCKRFLTDYVPSRIDLGRMAERTAADYRQQVKRYILPTLGKRKVSAVTRRDVERAVAGLAPVQRNRVLALISRIFSLAEVWEMRPAGANPARGIERSKEESRDRTLNGKELTALGEALDALADTYPMPVAVIRLCAMSGMRIGEALAIRWQDINFEASRVTLPKTKAGRQVRAVPRAALALFDGLPRINGVDWVFSGTRGRPVGYKHARTIFAKACERAGIEGATLHDLRRTIATGMAASGVGLTVLRDALGHRTTAMAARYARMADSAVAAAVEGSGGAIAAAMAGGEGAKILPLRR